MSDVSGEPALLLTVGGRLDTVLVFSIEDDRIAALRAVRNPDKLAWIGKAAAKPPL